MKAETVRVIFTNLIFVIGVVTLAVGFSGGALAIGRIIVFDEYPLPSFEESRCRIAPVPLVEGEKRGEIDRAEAEKCEEELVELRQIRKFEDLVKAASLLSIGGVLTYFFRGFIFDRKK